MRVIEMSKGQGNGTEVEGGGGGIVIFQVTLTA